MSKISPLGQQKDETVNLIGKNLKNLLNSQLAILKQYSHLLEKEKDSILGEDVEKMAAYVELEKTYGESLASDRQTLFYWLRQYDDLAQKPPGEIEDLRASISLLQDEAFKKNADNRIMLQEKLKGIKKELTGLKAKSFNNRSPYSRSSPPNFIDIIS